MEIELKFEIPDKETVEKLWNCHYLSSMAEPDSRESLEFRGVYFDTEDFALMKNDIAYRVRSEGEKVIATLKWNGTTEGALHTREEINIPVMDQAQMIKPNPVIFEESEIGEELMKIIGSKRLSVIMKTNHIRKRFKIDNSGTIMGVSIDEGEIETLNGLTPICEIEIEIFSGEEKILLKTGEKLRAKYGLLPQKKTKYYRGLELLGLAKDIR